MLLQSLKLINITIKSLKYYFKLKKKIHYLVATAERSLDSALSNHICGDALANALCNIPKKPPCRCPI